MNTYTFETTLDTAFGTCTHTIRVSAQSEEDAQKNLIQKVKRSPALRGALKKNTFKLVRADDGTARVLTEEQRKCGRHILENTDEKRLIMSAYYRGEPVALICAVKDLGENVAIKPLSIILTEEMLDSINDSNGKSPEDHGNNWS